eukprot:1291131-Alexandrium_andersonii.AAC.1
MRESSTVPRLPNNCSKSSSLAEVVADVPGGLKLWAPVAVEVVAVAAPPPAPPEASEAAEVRLGDPH